jgi:hypothetical protein
VELLDNGRVRYRLAFQDAPWLNSNDFTSDRIFAIGDLLDVDDGRGSTEPWSVADAPEEIDGVPDTLVLVRSGRD